MIREYYDAPSIIGCSIPATEHSTITSWGESNESIAYTNVLDKYPNGLVACVSDSYDIFNACENIWGKELRDKVLQRNGTLVIRPDSGNPIDMVIACLTILFDKFGGYTNTKGFKVLNDKVRLIQGDGVNIQSIREILESMHNLGWSSDNITFGMGGALLQHVTRDTLGFALKCSHAIINGIGVDVYKKPISDSNKNSKRGRMSLIKDENNRIITVPEQPDNDLLIPYFMNGEMLIQQNFNDIRKNASI